MKVLQGFYESIVRSGERVPVEHVQATLALHDLRASVEEWGR